MNKHQTLWDTIVIGSGLAGLSAAQQLQATGHSVLIIDKGRGVGGRLATRRIGDVSFDYGAQFFTARSPRFKQCVEQWIAEGVAEEWYSGYPGKPNSHARYRGVPTMTAVAKYLARDKNLQQATCVERISEISQGWQVSTDTAETFISRALLITCPVPQTLMLLSNSNISLALSMQERLERISYEHCIAVMALLDSPSNIPAPGALYLDQGPIAWISDNQKKKLSKIPAITLHASSDYSLENFDRDRQQVGLELLEHSKPWIGNCMIGDFQVHGWRYSKPTTVDHSESVLITESSNLPPIAVAGDAFAGPRFEGAVVSGWSAADTLQAVL
jgi:renalase